MVVVAAELIILSKFVALALNECAPPSPATPTPPRSIHRQHDIDKCLHFSLQAESCSFVMQGKDDLRARIHD
jgi:hypothetical protein